VLKTAVHVAAGLLTFIDKWWIKVCRPMLCQCVFTLVSSTVLLR